MIEAVDDTNKVNREQIWTRAGVVVFFGVLATSYLFLSQEIFLVPPLFQLSIPIYFLGWLPVLILWVLLTPARKRILLLITPGILFIVLVPFVLGESFYKRLIVTLHWDAVSCASFSAENEQQYVCYVPFAMYTDPFHFFEGPRYILLMIPSNHKTVGNMDLSGAVFYGQGLEGVNFSGVQLEGAEFFVTDLSRINFSGADLRNADMRAVDLAGANFENADLSGADLSFADLTGAHLSGTDLSGADLAWTNLIGANFESAVLIQTDLTSAEVDLEALEAAGTISEIIIPDGSIYTR
jgi:hypothetical protein